MQRDLMAIGGLFLAIALVLWLCVVEPMRDCTDRLRLCIRASQTARQLGACQAAVVCEAAR